MDFFACSCFLKGTKPMGIDIQKADFWKRISAWLFDFVLLIAVITLAAIPLSAIFKYDQNLKVVESIENEYREAMIADGLNPDITEEQLNALSPEEQAKYHAVDEKRAKDERLGIGYSVLSSTVISIVFISILIAYVIMEFTVPLFFKNGQTLGKKVFGLAVVHTNSVRFRGQAHFIRVIIGKCAIETMVPVFFVMMILFGDLGIVGVVLLLLIAVLQIYALASTKTRSAIHDLISDAAVVDLASQMIFENNEEMMAYKNKLHEEAISKAAY